jgi:hypothetical protein
MTHNRQFILFFDTFHLKGRSQANYARLVRQGDLPVVRDVHNENFGVRDSGLLRPVW